MVGQVTSNNLFPVIVLIASFIFMEISVWSCFQSDLICGFRLLFGSRGDVVRLVLLD